MLLPDTSFLLYVIIHSIQLSMIRAYSYCCSGVVRGGFGQNKQVLHLQVPGVDIFLDYRLVQHPTDQHTNQKVQEIRSFLLAFFFLLFFLSHPRVFSAHDFVKLSPFRNSYSGSHGTHTSPFPTTVLAFVLIAKEKRS